MVTRERVSLLRRLMIERRLTREETVALLHQRARALKVRDFALSLRQLDRWLAGDIGTLPRPSTCRVVEEEFGQSIESLLAVAGEAPVSVVVAEGVAELVKGAAHTSATFTAWADSVHIGTPTVVSLRLLMTQLAIDYVNRPLVPVFGDLVKLRDELFELLAKPDPEHLREAYFLAGATCGMLAYASGDLGFPTAAMLQANTALHCAHRADNRTLTAWLLGNQAMTSEWYGRPHHCIAYASAAVEHAQRARTPGTLGVRLASILAKAYAQLGDGPAARSALASADVARNEVSGNAGWRDEFDEIGGILTFTVAKQQVYGGSTYLRIGDVGAAEKAALTAITEYQSGQPADRSYGDEALAWIDVATARANAPSPQLDGAIEALNHVLNLPIDLRIPALTEPLTALSAPLDGPRLKGAADTRRLSEIVDHLLATCKPTVGGTITA